MDLRTERLVLSPLAGSDADAFFALHSDARTWRHFPMGRWTNPGEAASFIRMSEASFDRTGVGQYAVRRIGEARLIGDVGVFVMALATSGVLEVIQGDGGFENGVGGTGVMLNIGWRMTPEAWGGGYATEAARAVAQPAIGLWPDVPLTAAVLSTNPASAAVCRRLGLHVLWTGVSGEALRVRLARPPVSGGASCVRLFLSDRDVPADLIAARVRRL